MKKLFLPLLCTAFVLSYAPQALSMDYYGGYGGAAGSYNPPPLSPNYYSSTPPSVYNVQPPSVSDIRPPSAVDGYYDYMQR